MSFVGEGARIGAEYQPYVVGIGVPLVITVLGYMWLKLSTIVPTTTVRDGCGRINTYTE